MAEAKTKAQLEEELSEALATIERMKQQDDAEAEAEAIRQQAREEAAEIIARAKESAQAEAQDEEFPKAPARNDEGEEYVTIQLFKDSERYKDPLLVCVNGESVLIQRGVPVKIKRKFLWAIEQSQVQDAKTAQLITAESEAYREKQRAHRDS